MDPGVPERLNSRKTLLPEREKTMKNGIGVEKNKIQITLCFGSEREKKNRITCSWPRKNSSVSQEIMPFTLQLSGVDDVFSGQIYSEEVQYLKYLSLRVRLKANKKSRLYVTGTSRSPFLAIRDELSGNTLVLARKNPVQQNISFKANVKRGFVLIRWQFNQLMNPETPMELDHVFLRTGEMKDLLVKLTNDISRKHQSEIQSWDNTIWMVNQEKSNGILSVKALEEELNILESERFFYKQVRLKGLHSHEGDWETAHKEIGGRIGTITRRLEHNGMTPCLSFSPLHASTGSEVYKKHPEWLMRNLKDDLLPLLDITNPDVRSYLKTCLRTMREQWGFKAFHLTGLSILQEAHFKKDNAISSGDLIGRTIHFFRENMGKTESLSTEDIPHMPGLGNVKIHDTFSRDIQKRKALDAFRDIVISGVHNAPLNKRLWIENPGYFPCGKWADALPLQIRESLKQMILITGGVLMVSVDHRTLEKQEIQMLKSTFRTFDLFCGGDLFLIRNSGTRQPAILYNSIGKLGVFNLSGKTQTTSLELARLRQEIGTRTGTYIKEGNTGMQTGTLDLILPPYGSRIFNF